MGTKKVMKSPVKKYAAGGTQNCIKKKCSDTEYWRQDLCRCVKMLSIDSIKHPPSGNDSWFGAFGEYKDAEKMKQTAGSLFENVKKVKKKSKMGGVTYKTGGMVNSNTKLFASKVAKGTVGGKSKAPKNAVPKAKMGMSMKGKKSC